ncbi:MAG: DUF488 family protein [Hyphomicrobiaceae bacterium]
MTERKPYHVRIKRAYADPSRDDGRRVLVDRLWPRGMARDRLALDDWLKEAAPSNDLRRWFNHDPARWLEFVARYRDELKRQPASEAVAELVRCARQGPLTLVYAARDETYNDAVALRDLIAQHLLHGKGRKARAS